MNYQEWQESIKDVKLNLIDVNHDTQRVIYKIGDVNIYQDLIIPINPFKKSYELSVVDLQYKMTEENQEKVKKFNGNLIEEAWYSQAGYGMAIFESEEIDESLENAYNFLQNEIKG